MSWVKMHGAMAEGIIPLAHCEVRQQIRVKPYLHWQRLRDNAGNIDCQYLLALAALGSTT
jgi:hypothetical protein